MAVQWSCAQLFQREMEEFKSWEKKWGAKSLEYPMYTTGTDEIERRLCLISMMAASGEAPEAKLHWIGECAETWKNLDISVSIVQQKAATELAKRQREAHAAAAKRARTDSASSRGSTLSEQHLLEIERKRVAALQQKLKMMEENSG